MKADGAKVEMWSWVDSDPALLNQRKSGERGGFKRPWAIREELISQFVGAEIRRLREARKMTSYELAERLAISQPHLSYLEHGTRMIWACVLFDLADIFDVAPGHFLKVAERKLKAARNRPGLRDRRTAP